MKLVNSHFVPQNTMELTAKVCLISIVIAVSYQICVNLWPLPEQMKKLQSEIVTMQNNVDQLRQVQQRGVKALREESERQQEQLKELKLMLDEHAHSISKEQQSLHKQQSQFGSNLDRIDRLTEALQKDVMILRDDSKEHKHDHKDAIAQLNENMKYQLQYIDILRESDSTKKVEMENLRVDYNHNIRQIAESGVKLTSSLNDLKMTIDNNKQGINDLRTKLELAIKEGNKRSERTTNESDMQQRSMNVFDYIANIYRRLRQWYKAL
ncbi:structural maintenance of chromosomes protein 6-like [Anneissia japonica]|uniref:structural maintenance of chromosomes protein 6-like n=1 Tax=Anneissia japonica TaxID=1529436 RepID=UPI0014258A43|nr:structural maintenance of chromosomes protein 6-like [Anneissia japonica]